MSPRIVRATTVRVLQQLRDLETVCHDPDLIRQRRNLEAFLLRREREGDLGQIRVYRTRINGRIWFGVLFGEFRNYTQAREALRSLPASLTRFKPFIRNIKDIRALA